MLRILSGSLSHGFRETDLQRAASGTTSHAESLPIAELHDLWIVAWTILAFLGTVPRDVVVFAAFLVVHVVVLLVV